MRRANILLIIYIWWLWQVRFAKVAGFIVFFVLPRSVGRDRHISLPENARSPVGVGYTLAAARNRRMKT